MLLNVITSAVTAVAKASAASAKPASTSGGSSGSSGSWESNMAKIASGGSASIQAEIDRARDKIAKGQGTVATERYLNQMNALKDGKPLAEVMAGRYDGYRVDKGGVYNDGAYQGPIDDSRGGYRYENGVPVSTAPPPGFWDQVAAAAGKDVWTKRDEFSFQTATMDKDGNFIPSAYTSNVGSALAQGAGAGTWNQATGGFVNSAVMVLAGAAALVAVSKLFGK